MQSAAVRGPGASQKSGDPLRLFLEPPGHHSDVVPRVLRGCHHQGVSELGGHVAERPKSLRWKSFQVGRSMRRLPSVAGDGVVRVGFFAGLGVFVMQINRGLNVRDCGFHDFFFRKLILIGLGFFCRIMGAYCANK